MHKKLFITSFSLIIFITGWAQVTFIIDSLPDYTPAEDILYIAGDFQGWNPGDPEYALQKNAVNKWYITSADTIPSGTTIEFKFTRGDWGTVEKGEFGEEIPNREFTFGTADTVYIIIFNWADGGGSNSTAAENVVVMDEEFYMPQLDRNRRIWLYLPPDYEETELNYPVIYMHDGQNLFDTYTSFAGEWEVDETLNGLFNSGYQVPIVVGIDNGGTDRIDEYTPWPNAQYGGGDGDLYVDFIVETLKPYIDENFRTLIDRQSTGIWGSSLGGLISHYAALKHQDVFEKAGIYSPSYWFSDEVWSFVQDMGHQHTMRMYQMTGDQEGGSMVEDTWKMHDTLTVLGFDDTQLSTQINIGQHNEQLWREDFEAAYLWLFHSFANGIKEYASIKRIVVFPNPAIHTISVANEFSENIKNVMIFSITGRKVFETRSGSGSIDISQLPSGTYILEVLTDETIYRGRFVKR